jgi:hypothetical protein
MHYTSVRLYEMIGYYDQLFFLSRLCWKIILDTSKIVNHDRKLKMCN